MSSRTDAPTADSSTSEPVPARAARYHSVGGPEVINVETITVAAPGEGEVRIRLAAAGLNPVDYKIRRGTSRFPVTVPTTLGREFSGVVESVGAGVTDVAAGDHVFGSIPSGAACDLVVAPVDALAPVPDDVPLEVAGGLALAGQTAWDALESQHLAEGDTVVVSAAAGGVGGILCQLAIARAHPPGARRARRLGGGRSAGRGAVSARRGARGLRPPRVGAPARQDRPRSLSAVRRRGLPTGSCSARSRPRRSAAAPPR
ncbi:alcohol dehydrogenase catalytic domain-containing protein [Chryseoglobus sp. 28M-23]|nr:alcohol dehydrogenase catalytic domain-containing protein [Chryseoglobus sp. 28M-23]QOD92894.1 alcohol dehydrogenase catalytic domain-containing protein [Chryseoglobus sp. 28M-23]